MERFKTGTLNKRYTTNLIMGLKSKIIIFISLLIIVSLIFGQILIVYQELPTEIDVQQSTFEVKSSEPKILTTDTNSVILIESEIIDEVDGSKGARSGSNTKGNVRDTSGINFDLKTQYLIIAPTEFVPALEPLASWKHQKGVYTSIVTIDGQNGINSTFAGPDLAARIQAFLREYHNYTTDLKWLLLVGDSEIIPPRLLQTNVSTGELPVEIVESCYSDYYYAALDTSWDNNSNQIYGEQGEEDWVPDLFVGRLPVNTINEVANAVNKILIYEQSPPTGDWLHRSIQAGALMDRPNILDNPATYNTDEGYNDYKDNAYKAIMNVQELLPSWTNYTTFLDYDRIPGGEYSKANDTLNESNVLPIFNLGASTVNFVSKGDDNGVRHYSGNGLGKIEYNSEYFFSHETAKITSNGFKLPLLYTSSCTSVNFTNTDDTNLEYLINSPYGGAIGVIGATTETYRLEFYINDTSYGNWWLDAEFWRKFYSGEGSFRPGEILYKLKEDYYKYYNGVENPHHPTDPDPDENIYRSLYRINFFSYNLLGDPEIPIYTDHLREFSVEYNNQFSPVYRNSSLQLKILDKITEQPVQGAEICFVGDDLYFTTKTDNDGYASVNLDLQEQKYSIKFTITAHNYTYFSDSIKIEPIEDVLIKEGSLTFDQNPIAPGTIVNISYAVENMGQSIIEQYNIKCYSDSIDEENLINTTRVLDHKPNGGGVQLNFTWQPGPGSHNIIIHVDAFNEIFEYNETNNYAENMLIENKPPFFKTKLPYQIISEDEPKYNLLDISKYIVDPDTESLEYQILNISNPEFNISFNGSLVSLTPPDNFFGTVSAKIGVFDGISTAIEYLSILVEPVNDPPSINETIDWEVHSENVTIKPDRIIVLEDQFVNITVIASDIDDNNSKLVINAQSNSTKAGMFYLNSTNGQFKFLAENSDVGIYYLNFSVNDTHDQNNLAWREVIIDILDVNDPPILLVSNEKHVATVGKTFEYEIIGYDNDPFDSLKFTDDTHLFDIDPISGLIKFKPKNSQIGKHQITITITDKNGNESISKIFSLEINSKPEDPLSSNYIIICPIILVCIILAFFIQERLSHRSRSDIKAADKQKVKANQKNDRVDADDQKAEKEIDIENIQEIND